ncbi:MAG: CBS domain-containing protein [bacterium]|nr:CBS domain-containing protein [bacterium]
MAQILTFLERLLSRAKMAERTFMVAVAVVIGCLGGLGAVGFRWLISAIQRLSWGDWTFSLELVREHPWWWIVLTPAVGGLVVGPLVYFLAREAKGHGVPEVMEAVALRAGTIRPRLVIVKSLASAISIGTGGSVGREGPIVQIGSALGSTVGQLMRVSGKRLRTLVGCGAAAGIAATFNAPIAGALFAVEVILGDFAVAQFSPIVISSVVATVVSRHFLGDVPAFGIPEQYQMVSAWELPIYLVLGLVAALVAWGFVRLLYGLEDLFESFPMIPWLTAPIGGLLVGGIAIKYPEVFGVGYEAIEQALRGELVLGVLAVLLVLKLIATGITIGSGGSGGIFAPSLFLGAMTGGLVGTVANQLFPTVTASSGAYALVGMGAVVAGATHAPITAILIIFELTSDYKLIVPLMAACIIATLVTTRLQRESIYTMKLIRRGIDVFRGKDINVLRSLRVSDVMSQQLVKVREHEPFGELLREVATHPHAYFYVVDTEDRLKGFIVLSELRGALQDVDVPSAPLLATDLAREDIRPLTPDQDLDTVMRIFSGKNREELPVIAGDGTRKLLGVVRHRHLIEAYNRELMKRDMVAGLGSSLAGTATEEIHLGEDFRMVEIDAPGEFLNRSIRELDVRARYGAQILLLRRPSPTGDADRVEVIPEPETVVARGDRLVVVARKKDLERLQAL